MIDQIEQPLAGVTGLELLTQGIVQVQIAGLHTTDGTGDDDRRVTLFIHGIEHHIFDAILCIANTYGIHQANLAGVGKERAVNVRSGDCQILIVEFNAGIAEILTVVLRHIGFNEFRIRKGDGRCTEQIAELIKVLHNVCQMLFRGGLIGIAGFHLDAQLGEIDVTHILKLERRAFQVGGVDRLDIGCNNIQKLLRLAEGNGRLHRTAGHIQIVPNDRGSAGTGGSIISGDDAVIQIAHGLEKLALALTLLANGGNADVIPVEALDTLVQLTDQLIHPFLSRHGVDAAENGTILGAELLVLDIPCLHNQSGAGIAQQILDFLHSSFALLERLTFFFSVRYNAVDLVSHGHSDFPPFIR